VVNRITGLSTGFDIDQWVTDLMKARRAGVDKLYQKKRLLEWQRDDYRGINTRLLALRSVTSELRLQGSFSARTASSSDDTVLTAAASGSAVPASYAVKVNALASGVTRTSTAALGSSTDKTSLASQFGLSGTVTFTLEGKNGVKEFSFDTATTTLNQVVAAINEAGIGIRASYDATLDRFFLMSQEAGSAAEIHAHADAEGFLTGTLKLALAVGAEEANAVRGSDANLDFNDATGLTFPSNQVTVNGVTLTLKSVSASTVTVTVSRDVEATVAKIKAWVTAYNDALGLIHGELTETRYRDYLPLTDVQKEEMKDKEIEEWEAKARSGLLKGDSLLARVHASLRGAVGPQVSGLAGAYTSLSAIGITTGPYTEGGKLYVDEAKLREALAADPEGVRDLFTRNREDAAQDGIAVRLYEAVNAAMTLITGRAGSGSSFRDSASTISKELGVLERRIRAWEGRLQDQEARYYKQFSAMETAIQQLSAQSAWLAQAFGGGASE
jgi:flagellar hook-associated protein 2